MLDQLRETLAGTYQVERELGAGGMGRVFLARETALGRQVAIKVLRTEVSAELSLERFRREIQIAAALRHPHIVPLLSAGDVNGALYYTMPFVQGESLRDLLSRERQLPVERALHLAMEVADALAYAHSQGIVHRDIKPENILLDSGHAVVTDFGIARAVSGAEKGSLTRTGVVVGTPAYMSPEQFSGDSVDGRSDVYSLGCVLVEMLTGRPPTMLAATKPAETDGIPPRVRSVVAIAVASDPSERFATAGEFLVALREASDSQRRPGRVILASKRVWWIGASSLALLVTLFVAHAWIQRKGVAKEQRAAPAPVAPRISVQFDQSSLQDVAQSFAFFAGKSIVVSPGAADVKITARFDNQPWDIALRSLANANQFEVIEDPKTGILVILTFQQLREREANAPLIARAYSPQHARSSDLVALVRIVLSPKGQVAADTAGNRLVVTESATRMADLLQFIRSLDVKTSDVTKPPN